MVGITIQFLDDLCMTKVYCGLKCHTLVNYIGI